MATVYCETQDGKSVAIEGEKARLRVSAYGILIEDQSVLVTQTYLPLWEFPGGAVERGETLSQALKREFQEETGVKIETKQFLIERECFYLSPKGTIFHSFQHFFLVKPKNGSWHNEKFLHPEVRLASISSLSSRNMKKSAFDVLSFLKNKNNRKGNFLAAFQ